MHELTNVCLDARGTSHHVARMPELILLTELASRLGMTPEECLEYVYDHTRQCVLDYAVLARPNECPGVQSDVAERLTRARSGELQRLALGF